MADTLDCSLCGTHAPIVEVLTTNFRDAEPGRFSVVRCGTCGHVQVSPLPSEEEEAAYYARDMQPRALFKDGDYHGILRSKALPEISRRFEHLFRRMPASSEVKPRILDVGSGYGFFVDFLASKGYDAHGLEISSDRMVLADGNMRGSFFHRALDDAFVDEHAGTFDAVTAYHVVEHLRDPVGTVARMFRLVRGGGLVVIEVPNLADELAGQISEYASHLWQICHLSYFDAAHMELLLRRAGATDFAVEGVQRYGLDHLLKWSRDHEPDLSPFVELSRPELYNRIEELYRRDRTDRSTCDTIIAAVVVDKEPSKADSV